jgi:transposase
MSGVRPTEMREFYLKLHSRGLGTKEIATQLGVSGGAVRRLLGNLRPRRGPIWRGILALLTAEEISLLFSVEQRATWNARQLAKRPVWTAVKEAEILQAKAAHGHFAEFTREERAVIYAAREKVEAGG